MTEVNSQGSYKVV